MGKNNNNPFLKPIAVRRWSRQKVKDILREKGIQLVPDYAGEVFINPNISRSWSTLWGWNGDSLVRVRVDDDGRVVTTKALSTNSVFVTYNTHLIAGLSGHEFNLGHICNRVQVFSVATIVLVKLGLATGEFFASMICKPFTSDYVANNVGSLGVFDCRAQFVRVENTIDQNASDILVIGSYEKKK